MPTPQQLADDHAAYAAAYDQEPGQASAPADGSPAEEASESPAQEAAETGPADDTAAGGTPGGQTETEAQGDDANTSSGEPRDAGDTPASAEGADAPTAAGDGQGSVDIAKETQRLKSWEGRLKKIQAELDAKSKGDDGESGTTEAIEEVADKANVQGNTELSQAADKAADQVEQGAMTPEQAMKQLAEDFGDDFVSLISIVAKHIAGSAATETASKHVAGVSKSVDDIVQHLSDEKARQHFEEIGAAHPDYDSVARSPEFKAFVLALPGDEKSQAEATLKGGTSKDINALLSRFKKSAAKDSPNDVESVDPAAKPEPTDPAVAAKMDDAEGVRTKGAIKLPEQPAGNQSYEDAWKALS